MSNDIDNTIHVSISRYHGGPLDGGLETEIGKSYRHEVTWPVYLTDSVFHPFLAHVYGRIGATGHFFYKGVRSLK